MTFATSSASPPKTKTSPWGVCTLIVPLKIVDSSIVSEDRPREVILGASLGGVPLRAFG